MMDERAHARRTDPQTSHDAAASVKKISETKKKILLLLRKAGPMTDEELVNMWRVYQLGKISESCIRSRRADLVKMNMVEYTGEKRVISTGRDAQIWRAK